MEHHESTSKQKLAENLISVDCVIFGFDGEDLKVLLYDRGAHETPPTPGDMKLPGDIIYLNEDLNEAATRILYELTGLRNMSLRQFKAFGSKDRTNKQRDVEWLVKLHNLDPDNVIIVTVAYLAFVRIDRNVISNIRSKGAKWVSVSELDELAFDHNAITRDALVAVRNLVETDPIWIFNVLPHKFTAAQIRKLYEKLYNKELDVRNFQKKLNSMTYVVPLEEKEQNVSHRAARYYRFDKVAYNKR